MTTAGYSPADHSALQRRTLGVLFASSIPARAAMSLAFTVAGLAIKEMLDGDRWAGLSTVAITIGTAVASGWLSSLMMKSGRNPGLRTGYAVATAGALIGGFGIERSSITIFLAGLFLFGVGQGATNLSRYAAADLATEETRAKAISTVVFASAFGSVFGPMIAGLLGDLSVSAGMNELTGPFLGSAVFFALSGLVIWLLLRPDPLTVSGGLNSQQASTRVKLSISDSLAIVWARPLARLAAATLVISQLVMVMVMAMTPLHMDAHGHSTGWIGLVISAHTAGMFLFAPIAGFVSDKIGRIPTILSGAALLTLSTIITALAGEAPRVLMFPGLFLLGLGWSFGMVAGSALLTESVSSEERVSVQGAADIATSLASGGGALASGFVFDMAGFHILSLMGTAAAGGLMLFSFVRSKLDGTGPDSGPLPRPA